MENGPQTQFSQFLLVLWFGGIRGGGGAHKHFFDRDARPRTNFNYPKNRMTLNSNPQKIECPKIQTEKK